MKDGFKLTSAWLVIVLSPCREAYTAPGINSGAVGEKGRDGNSTPKLGTPISTVGDRVELKSRPASEPLVDTVCFPMPISVAGLSAAWLANDNTELDIASKPAWKDLVIQTEVLISSSQWMRTDVKKRVKFAEPV